jgi:hypothetical protein
MVIRATTSQETQNRCPDCLQLLPSQKGSCKSCLVCCCLTNVEETFGADQFLYSVMADDHSVAGAKPEASTFAITNLPTERSEHKSWGANLARSSNNLLNMKPFSNTSEIYRKRTRYIF